MTEDERDRPSLKSFDAYADRNGQDLGQDDPRDVGNPADLRHAMTEDPGRQAEAARIASGSERLDATEGGSVATVEATEAETPPENLRRIGDPASRGPAASEAIERATAAVGEDPGE